MRSRNALNNKQTGHCMPSSQDVLPSASTLTGIGGEKRPFGPGSADCCASPSPITSTLPASPLHCPVQDQCSAFLPWVSKRCLPCFCQLVLRQKGKILLKGRNKMLFLTHLTSTDLGGETWEGIKSETPQLVIPNSTTHLRSGSKHLKSGF